MLQSSSSHDVFGEMGNAMDEGDGKSFRVREWFEALAGEHASSIEPPSLELRKISRDHFYLDNDALRSQL